MAASDSTMRRTKARRRIGRPPRRTPQKGTTAFNLIARLVAWYMLYTILFQCPSNPGPDSSALCLASHRVKTTLRPHVVPYYDGYIAPYVDQYSPYVHYANKQYITPAYRGSLSSYTRYAQPVVEKGKAFIGAEYERVLKPYMRQASRKGTEYYGAYLSPHVETAGEVWSGLKPRIEATKKTVDKVWEKNLRPTYRVVAPCVFKTYESVKHVLLTIVTPVVREGGQRAVGWGRGMWSEVVQPQVGRIGERLSSSNGNGVPASEMSSPKLSSLSVTKAERSASSSALSSMISSVSSKASISRASNSATPSGKTKKPRLTKEEERVIIKEDVEAWSQKFNSAEEKAIGDLRTQIMELIGKGKREKADKAQKDNDALEAAVNDGLEKFKKNIIDIVKTLSKDSTKDEKNEAHEKMFAAARSIGIPIRDQAQAIRKEAEAFLAKVYDDVSEAADQNLDVLENIQDLGMQELGMKWAWMEYVTYKDWKKYHEIKRGHAGSRGRIVRSAEDNEELVKFTEWVEDTWEGRATEIARKAADELKRLKTAGKKKIELADPSDDFSDDYVPLAARKATQQILDGVEKLKEAVVGTDETQDELLKNKVMSAADVLSSAVTGGSPSAPAAESIASAVSSPTEEAKAHVLGGVHAGIVANAEKVVYEDDSVTEQIKSRLVEASKAASQAILDAVSRGTPTPEPAVHESLISYMSVISESAVSAASSVLYGTPTPVIEHVSSIAADKYSAAVAAASSVFYGKPTPTHELLLNSAKRAYTSATNAALDTYNAANRRAVTKVHASEKPIKESMYSVAAAQYSAALTAAEASYTSFTAQAEAAKQAYSDTIASAEAILGAASAAAAAQASAASEKVYGTPAPDPGSADFVVKRAREMHEASAKKAKEQYEEWYKQATGYSDFLFGAAQERYEGLQNLFEELVRGKEESYQESVRRRFSRVVYGTKTPLWQQATIAAAQAAARVTDDAAEAVSKATQAVGDAAAKVADVAVDAAERAEEGFESLKDQVREKIEKASEKVASATEKVKDEL